MLILAIESSCDETSIAFLQKNENAKGVSFEDYLSSFVTLSNIVSSQIQTHAQYGGVIPEVGARLHAENIHNVFNQALEKIGKSFSFLSELDYIFVTSEPGLISALRVGIEFAKTLQFFIENQFNKKVEIRFVNHLRGHVASCFYENTKTLVSNNATQNIFPHLHLLVSGGNSQLILLESWSKWSIVGQTLDDAAGETLDKIARMLGISYPGGATIAKIAGLVELNDLNLPISMKGSELNYSFSGLKTSVRYLVQKQHISGLEFEKKLSDKELLQLIQNTFIGNQKLEFIAQVCVSTQYVVVDQLIRKMNAAANKFQPQSIGISGGVSANKLLREKINSLAKKKNISRVFVPHINLSGDNAVMIGLAGVAELFG